MPKLKKEDASEASLSEINRQLRAAGEFRLTRLTLSEFARCPKLKKEDASEASLPEINRQSAIDNGNLQSPIPNLQ